MINRLCTVELNLRHAYFVVCLILLLVADMVGCGCDVEDGGARGRHGQAVVAVVGRRRGGVQHQLII